MRAAREIAADLNAAVAEVHSGDMVELRNQRLIMEALAKLLEEDARLEDLRLAPWRGSGAWRR